MIGTKSFTVTAATLTSLAITPATGTLPLGNRISLTATGIYSDNTHEDLTDQVTWTSSDPLVARFSTAAGSEGVVTGAGTGRANGDARVNWSAKWPRPRGSASTTSFATTRNSSAR